MCSQFLFLDQASLLSEMHPYMGPLANPSLLPPSLRSIWPVVPSFLYLRTPSRSHRRKKLDFSRSTLRDGAWCGTCMKMRSGSKWLSCTNAGWWFGTCFFPFIFGIITPIDLYIYMCLYFSQGLNPPTRMWWNTSIYDYIMQCMFSLFYRGWRLGEWLWSITNPLPVCNDVVARINSQSLGILQL